MRKAKKTSKGAGVERPFDRGTWRRALKTAQEYRLILEPDESGGYIGSAIEFPTVLAHGQTPNECVDSTRQALAVAAATMIESGRRPPLAGRRGTRQCQINIRVTAVEKFALDDAAKRFGFKGIADFVRTVALERTSAARFIRRSSCG